MLLLCEADWPRRHVTAAASHHRGPRRRDPRQARPRLPRLPCHWPGPEQVTPHWQPALAGRFQVVCGPTRPRPLPESA
eukprot:1992324-Rhodomonas_salina.1